MFGLFKPKPKTPVKSEDGFVVPKGVDGDKAKLYYEVFCLCSGEILDKLVSKKGRELAVTLNTTVDQLAEATGVIQAKHKLTRQVACSDNEQEIETIDQLIEKHSSPEYLTQFFLAYINRTTPNCKTDEKVNGIFSDVIKLLDQFNTKYYEYVQADDLYIENLKKQVADVSVNQETQGMGFGLLTTSVTHAIAFQLMDAHEHKVQKERQIYEYRNRMDASLSYRAANMHDRVYGLYNIFTNGIKGICTEYQDYLEKKDGLAYFEDDNENIMIGGEACTYKSKSSNVLYLLEKTYEFCDTIDKILPGDLTCRDLVTMDLKRILLYAIDELKRITLEENILICNLLQIQEGSYSIEELSAGDHMEGVMNIEELPSLMKLKEIDKLIGNDNSGHDNLLLFYQTVIKELINVNGWKNEEMRVPEGINL